ISLQLREITLLVLDVLSKLIPRSGLGFAETGELIDPIAQPMAQRVITEFDAVHRDDRELCGLAAILREIEQGRDQFAPSQVTGTAEYDEQNWIQSIGGFHRFHNPSRPGSHSQADL